MPQSFAVLHIHLVFSTKHRFPFLTDKALREEMHRYLAAVSAELGCATVAVGGVADHVHLLARLARTRTVADWVKEVKRVSSLWAKTRCPDWAGFSWQNGYGAFAVGQRQLAVATAYIRNQEAHHQPTTTFQDEYRGLLIRTPPGMG